MQHNIKTNFPKLVRRFSKLAVLIIFLRKVLLLLIVCFLCWHNKVHNTKADCPNMCQCKWTNGKDSAVCLSANLTTIPKLFDLGTQVLDLSGNNIRNIHEDAFVKAKLLNLQKLLLVNCHLLTVERTAFRMLNNLVQLDLSLNMIDRVPSDSFNFVSALRELKLNGNPIHNIENKAFAMMPQLVRLELSNCKIDHVQEKAFAGLELHLEWLKLDGNHLKTMNAETFAALQNLHGIELAHNKWNCTCLLRSLRKWLYRKNIPFGISPVCHTPAHLNGKAWNNVDLDEFACRPHVRVHENNIHGIAGRNITMRCYGTGLPVPLIYWGVENRFLSNYVKFNEPDIAKVTSMKHNNRIYVGNIQKNASDLTIVNAEVNHSGTYVCIAENKAGRSETAIILEVGQVSIDHRFKTVTIYVCGIIAAIAAVCAISIVNLCFIRRRKRNRNIPVSTVPLVSSEEYGFTVMSTQLHRTKNDNQKKYSFDNLHPIAETTYTVNTRNIFDKTDRIIPCKLGFETDGSIHGLDEALYHNAGGMQLKQERTDQPLHLPRLKTLTSVPKPMYSQIRQTENGEFSMLELVGYWSCSPSCSAAFISDSVTSTVAQVVTKDFKSIKPISISNKSERKSQNLQQRQMNTICSRFLKYGSDWESDTRSLKSKHGGPNSSRRYRDALITEQQFALCGQRNSPEANGSVQPENLFTCDPRIVTTTEVDPLYEYPSTCTTKPIRALRCMSDQANGNRAIFDPNSLSIVKLPARLSAFNHH